MRRKTFWFVVPVVVLALAAGTAWSFGPGQGPGRGSGRHGGGMRGMPMLAHPGVQEQLGLTPEQVGQLRSLFFEGARAGIRQRAELKVLRLELEQLLQADAPDRGAIEGKLAEISAALHALMTRRVEQRLALREILTPEQREKMRTLLRQRMMQRFQRRQPMRRPGRGHGPGSGFGPGFDLDPSFEPAEPPLE